jgi:hypothetical protein
LTTLLDGFVVQLGVEEVEVGVVRPGLQEQAELIFFLSALQPGVTLAGRPVLAVLTVAV